MQTTLPDLPFLSIGIHIPRNEPRSTSKATPRAFPRTDLETLDRWTTFNEDIERTIHTAMEQNDLIRGTRLIVGNLFRIPPRVSNEETLRAHVISELYPAVTEVLHKLGVRGMFGPCDSGNIALVGSPDFIWMKGEDQMHPKLVIEYKTGWVADLEDLPTFFAKSDHNRNEKQLMEALEQVYGYMTFNNNRYGVLSNWTHTWFLRRMETDECKTLECAGPIGLVGAPGEPSILKAMVGMVLLAEKDWFYASPTLDLPPPSRYFRPTETALKMQERAIIACGKYDVTPANGTYPCLDLDFHLCNFQLSTAHQSSTGCVVSTHLLQDALNKPPLVAMCKVMDITRHPNNGISLKDEARIYAIMHNLQGNVIPRVFGYYNVWGILDFLALEPVGCAVAEDKVITRELRRKMKLALGHIHSAGYVHGDIARRNFCEKDGKVYLVDLETCRASDSRAEMDAEERLIDSL